MARGVNTKANGIDFRANRFDEFLKLIPQNLTDAEKAQVMANLGITPTPGSLDGAVRYDAAQTLTDEQKQQAQENAGVAEALDGKANNDGYYSKMTVGAAENLEGGNETSREFTEDTAGGSADIADGIAQIEKIKGNTIVWNQLVGNETAEVETTSGHKYRFADSTNSTDTIITSTGQTLSVVGGTDMVFDLTKMFGAGNEPATVAEFRKMFPLDYYNYNKGQLLSLNPTGILTDGFNQYNHNDPHINVFAQAYYIGGTYTSLWFSKSKTDIATAYAFGDTLTAGSFYTNGGTHYKSNVSVAAYDSSKTYAVGAYCIEGSVVYKCNTAITAAEAFDASKWTSLVDVAGMVTDGILTSVEITPVDHLFTPTEQGYVHVEGGNATNTVVNLHWSGKRDGEYEPYWQSTRNIPIAQINTDGTITESAVGKSRLFPDGLCSAGSVHDEITPTKAIKRIGKVDLGMMSWSNRSGENYFFSTIPNDMRIRGTGAGAETNRITSLTYTINFWTFHHYREINISATKDYSTAEDFKAAMSGVYLYYELATPIEVTFAEPLNLTYRVSDFGTETLLPQNGAAPTTTPIKMDVVYGLNVVDFVRNADKNFVTIEDGTGDNGSTFTNLRSALSTAFAIDIVPTYDATNNRYTFAITDNRKVEVPASATASGLKGTWAEDETAVYFCIDTDTWIKINKETW